MKRITAILSALIIASVLSLVLIPGQAFSRPFKETATAETAPVPSAPEETTVPLSLRRSAKDIVKDEPEDVDYDEIYYAGDHDGDYDDGSEESGRKEVDLDELYFAGDYDGDYDPDKYAKTQDPNWYRIDVNLSYCTITIYEVGTHKEPVPIKKILCSPGQWGSETPTGTFYLQDKHRWCKMEHDVYAQYACRITGGVMFHSVWYNSFSSSDLSYTEYNKLGNPASMGCVRMNVKNAKWIFDNIAYGTEINIFYDDETPGPLGEGETFYLPTYMWELRGWDPTDPSTQNPWRYYEMTVYCPPEIHVPVGSYYYDLYNDIYVEDNYGYDVTEFAEIVGNFSLTEPGTYPCEIVVTVTNRVTRRPVMIIVE